jgi:hypothetical protein
VKKSGTTVGGSGSEGDMDTTVEGSCSGDTGSSTLQTYSSLAVTLT